jgi:DUF177 domain-containing protein
MRPIHIGSITDKGLIVEEQVDAQALPLLNALAHEGSLSFAHPVHTRIRATLSNDAVLIDGTVQTTVRMACSRCLTPFAIDIESDFSATAMPETEAMADTAAADDIELTADEMNVIIYHGDSIDLGHEISQQIIMALPFKPLCRETCKGLCSRCGADLNKAPCRCDLREKNSPFEVLKTRTFPKKKE